MKMINLLKSECELSPQDREMHGLSVAFLLAVLTIVINYVFTLGLALSLVFYSISLVVTFILLFKCYKCRCK